MNEHEFKPILAEIQDKPPNPLGRLFLWILLTLMVLVIAWMYFAKVDVVVSARGKVGPDGDLKALQPFEIGVIRKILVKEGDYVKEGQVLVEIDPTVEVADIQGKERNLFFHKLTNRRVKATLSSLSIYSSTWFFFRLISLSRLSLSLTFSLYFASATAPAMTRALSFSSSSKTTFMR